MAVCAKCGETYNLGYCSYDREEDFAGVTFGSDYLNRRICGCPEIEDTKIRLCIKCECEYYKTLWATRMEYCKLLVESEIAFMNYSKEMFKKFMGDAHVE